MQVVQIGVCLLVCVVFLVSRVMYWVLLHMTECNSMSMFEHLCGELVIWLHSADVACVIGGHTRVD